MEEKKKKNKWLKIVIGTGAVIGTVYGIKKAYEKGVDDGFVVGRVVGVNQGIDLAVMQQRRVPEQVYNDYCCKYDFSGEGVKNLIEAAHTEATRVKNFWKDKEIQK